MKKITIIPFEADKNWKQNAITSIANILYIYIIILIIFIISLVESNLGWFTEYKLMSIFLSNAIISLFLIFSYTNNIIVKHINYLKVKNNKMLFIEAILIVLSSINIPYYIFSLLLFIFFYFFILSKKDIYDIYLQDVENNKFQPLNFPKLEYNVSDFSSVLRKEAINRYNNLFSENQEKWWEQIAFVIFPHREWNELLDIWLKLFNENWIWDKQTNNWLMLIISSREKKLRILVWKWLEKVFTDSYCKEIVEWELRPLLDKWEYELLLKVWYEIIVEKRKIYSHHARESNIINIKNKKYLDKVVTFLLLVISSTSISTSVYIIFIEPIVILKPIITVIITTILIIIIFYKRYILIPLLLLNIALYSINYDYKVQLWWLEYDFKNKYTYIYTDAEVEVIEEERMKRSYSSWWGSSYGWWSSSSHGWWSSSSSSYGWWSSNWWWYWD